jgi:hypothetical protein
MLFDSLGCSSGVDANGSGLVGLNLNLADHGVYPAWGGGLSKH